jgi:RNA polymerase sigma factor (sigma-70 family)
MDPRDEARAQRQAVDAPEPETRFRKWLALTERAAAALRRRSAAFRAGRQGADAVQEAMLWACRHRGELLSKPEAVVGALLRRVLHDRGANLARDEGRREHRPRRPVAGPAAAPQAPPAEAPLLDVERGRVVAEALGRLPARLREVIRLRFWGGLSWGEVGRRLGFTERHARALQGQAREQLRRILEGRL